MRDYIKRNLVLCVIGVASAAWACGDDDDDGSNGSGGSAGKGGSSGSVGKGGSSGSVGKGGSSGSVGKGGSSGSVGKGGSSGGVGKGGTSGSAGSPEGGSGGDGETAGAGGDQGGSGGSTSSGGAGSGGEEAGGAGGSAGAAAGEAGTGSDAGGAAGAGGAPAEPTVSELCTTICTRVGGFASTTTCSDENCVATCEAQISEESDASATNVKYTEMIACLVNNLDASEDYMCADGTTLGNLWSVAVAETGAANACDEVTCAWTCDPFAYGADPTLVYGACECL